MAKAAQSHKNIEAGADNVRTKEPSGDNSADNSVLLDNDGNEIRDRIVAHDDGGAVAQILENGSAGGIVGVDPTTGEVVTSEGSRMRRAFMLKQLLPGKDWIMKNVVGGGVGTRATVGRVVGICYGAEPKQNTMGDGSISDSVVMKGDFEYQSYVMPEEKGAASLAYLPRSYSDKILHILTAPGVKDRSVVVDVDIGLEATGKTIPYEWTVTTFVEGEEMRIIKKLRNARKPPTLLLTPPVKG